MNLLIVINFSFEIDLPFEINLSFGMNHPRNTITGGSVGVLEYEGREVGMFFLKFPRRGISISGFGSKAGNTASVRSRSTCNSWIKHRVLYFHIGANWIGIAWNPIFYVYPTTLLVWPSTSISGHFYLLLGISFPGFIFTHFFVSFQVSFLVLFLDFSPFFF